ncbi:MAG: hydantoinase/oxoprolinase family protein [Alphaproteobacteria bacterium]|nr:hydantoinase/oxoprolinase family protein [Alphaproteobacteria bacterium]
MAIFLGVDTGGTYTDAVLLQDQERVLATNALVEGHGGRIALVSVGFSEADMRRQNLGESLNGDPLICLDGGHDHSGTEILPLDLATLKTELETIARGVSAIAIVSRFATRNPAHEIKVRDMILAHWEIPVSCSHELSAKLNGPKRAMTAVLNARLIGLIDHLILAAEGLLKSRGIKAPLMVVRGDGALVSAEMARLKPIETILSGPAASLVGARWLTRAKNAIVADIGGTTTDIAVLHDGHPKIDPLGARVGPFRTMVEAVAMRTHGLGGDSQVSKSGQRLGAQITLGPKRLLPVSLCAIDWPELVHGALDRQLGRDRAGEFDAMFVVPLHRDDLAAQTLEARQSCLLETIGDQAREMGQIISGRLDFSAIEDLVARGLIALSGVTPTDAAHVLDRQNDWDKLAAQKALTLFSRQRTSTGNLLAQDGKKMAETIIRQLTNQTVQALMTTGFAEDQSDWQGLDPEHLAQHVLTSSGLDGHRGLLALDVGLNLPVIGLGAAASTYYPTVGKRLNTTMILPEHAAVANALGAVVGQVSVKAAGTISCPNDGIFRVHFPQGPADFTSEHAAFAALEDQLEARARALAKEAGAEDIHLATAREIRRSRVGDREIFVEAELVTTASGRPRIVKP